MSSNLRSDNISRRLEIERREFSSVYVFLNEGLAKTGEAETTKE